MTQKYKKNNSPAIQNSIFSSFPDVFQTILSGFPDVSQPNLSDSPDVSQPDFPCFPDVFWFRYGATCLAFQKNMGDLQVRSPIRVMWKTLVVFGDKD